MWIWLLEIPWVSVCCYIQISLVFVDEWCKGWIPLIISNGQRNSSAMSYLGPQFIQRKNIQFYYMLKWLALFRRKIVKASLLSGRWNLRIVVLVVNSIIRIWIGCCPNVHPVSRTLITAKNEVILSAGVVASGKSEFFLQTLGHAYNDLISLPSTVKLEVTKPCYA
jgi:hypothetical protein